MKGVICVCYSSDNQLEESIEGQFRNAWSTQRTAVLRFHYIDRVLSTKTGHRSEFHHMIIDRCKQLFDMVIAWKLGRFARNRYDSVHYKAILCRDEIKAVSAREIIVEYGSNLCGQYKKEPW